MNTLYGTALAAALAVTAGSARAQDAAPVAGVAAADGDIVVTARKRAESIQSVPVAVTAIDAAGLSRMHIDNIAEIRNAPNVNIVSGQFQPSGAVFYIRGVGNKAQEPYIDTPVAISIDGVYLASSTGSLIDFFDVQQVEVLRGPQGTLQGRNSPGGAINITTRRPSGKTEFNGELGYGRFNTFDVKLGAEAPIVADKLAVRASLLISHGDGGVRNIFDGSHLGGRRIYSGRLSFLFTPTPDFDLFLSGDFTANRSEQTGARNSNTSKAYPGQGVSVACAAFGFCTPLPAWTVDTDFNAPYRSNGGGISATANWRLGDVTLTSVTGYRKFKDHQNIDVDGLPIPFIAAVDRRFDLDQFSEELRLSSDRSGKPVGGQLDWVFGGIYFDSSYKLIQPISVFAGPPAIQFAHQKLKSYAVFGQATYHITDAWSVSGGFRQTWDRKRYDGIQPGFTTADEVSVYPRSNNFSIEAGTEYKITPDHLIYARFSQGYRAGGANGGAQTPAAVTIFKPEKVNSYEIGAKTEWLDRRLTFNVTLFQADYKDLQREIVIPPIITATTIANAANARIKGVEIEAIARPSDLLTVRLSYGYLKSKYRSFFADLTGSGVPRDNSDLRLPFAPHNSLTLGTDFHLPLASGDRITLSSNVEMKSSYTVQPLDTQIGADDGYVTVDLSARYDLANGRLGFEVYALNIFGQNYIIAGENLGGASYYRVDGPRPSYGGRVTFKF